MNVRLLLFAVFATCLPAPYAQAQYGTPFELRDTTPTIEDAAPGREPASEAKVAAETYRVQTIAPRYRCGVASLLLSTVVSDQLASYH